VSPLCSRNAHDRNVLVRRAQWGTHPGHPLDTVNERAWKNYLWSLAAALPVERRVSARRGRAGETSGLFEHPVLLERQFHVNAFSQCFVYKPSFSTDC
jgi:hypothetical protein